MLPGISSYVFPDPWAQTVTVVPGYSNGTAPFGDATATQLHAWTNFTVDADWQHDLGVITLDRPIGGWDYRIGFFAPTWGGTSGPISAMGQVIHNPNLPEFLASVCRTSLDEGQSYDVEWEPVSGASGGRLRLSTDGGSTFTLVTELSVGTLAAGTWNWTVPQADTDRALLQLELDYAGGSPTAASRYFTINLVTTAPGEVPSIQGVRLVGNFPKPFNPATTIVYRLEQTTSVRRKIYDLSGRKVRRLVEGVKNGPQQHEVIWNGRGDDGRRVASGVYLCRLATPLGNAA